MSEDHLDDLVRHAEFVEVRRKPASERVPAMPFDSGTLQCRPNDIANKARWMPMDLPMLFGNIRPDAGEPLLVR